MNVTTLWYWVKWHDCKNNHTTEMIAKIPILQYHLK